MEQLCVFKVWVWGAVVCISKCEFEEQSCVFQNLSLRNSRVCFKTSVWGTVVCAKILVWGTVVCAKISVWGTVVCAKISVWGTVVEEQCALKGEFEELSCISTMENKNNSLFNTLVCQLTDAINRGLVEKVLCRIICPLCVDKRGKRYVIVFQIYIYIYIYIQKHRVHA